MKGVNYMKHSRAVDRNQHHQEKRQKMSSAIKMKEVKCCKLNHWREGK